MVPASSSDPVRPPAWQRWLLLGLLCGLGYGLTMRLVGLSFSGDWGGTQLFGVKPLPGTGLDSLRQGARPTDLRADLDRLERQRLERLQQQQAASRREATAERERQEQQRQQEEESRRRLDELEGRAQPEPPPLPEEAPISSPLLSPPEPARQEPQAEEAAPAPQP